MSRMIKDLRTNMMYWRFRYITRNRLRLQSAWYRRRQPRPVYRPRATAPFVYRRSSSKTWIALLVMVAMLTAISVATNRGYVPSGLNSLASVLVVIAAIYWATKNM
ncbi:MAG: hypothetical protein NVS2B16_16550 [Chloroflexota bacterium]